MSITIFRPGQQLYIPGVQVLHTNPPAASSNWWEVSGQTCVAAYQPKGAASLAASYVNLANPGTNDAAPGIAPTWDSVGGWTFNGSSQYLATGIVATRSYTVILRYSGSTAAYQFGAFATSPTRIYGFSHNVSGKLVFWNGTGFNNSAATATSGVAAIAGSNAYFNGSSVGTVLANADTGLALFIGALNQSGTPGSYGGGSFQALAIYSTTLGAGDVASLTTAMNAL